MRAEVDVSNDDTMLGKLCFHTAVDIILIFKAYLAQCDSPFYLSR